MWLNKANLLNQQQVMNMKWHVPFLDGKINYQILDHTVSNKRHQSTTKMRKNGFASFDRC